MATRKRIVTQKPHRKEGLVTRGIPTAQIPGLIVCESPTFAKEVQALETLTKPSYRHDEVFGPWVSLAEHIDVPLDVAFEYIANIYSCEEYTATLRKFEYVGGGLYRALDVLAPNTYIYMKIVAHRESGVIDYLCAWDQGQELWMRYHWRLLDALVTLGKPGTVLLWNNCRHAYYDKSSPAPPHVAEPRARTDRLWVGDFWRHFYAAHQMEASNLKKILEYRFKS